MERIQHSSSREQVAVPFISAHHTSPNKQTLERLSSDLQEIKWLEYGRPIRYYHAFRAYTIYTGIALLEGLLAESSPDEKATISKLLSDYHSMTEE